MGKKRHTKQDYSKIEVYEVINLNQDYYEIGGYVTNDVAEAVSLMMRRKDLDSNIWNAEFKSNQEDIDSRKCLYWLTGGDVEWIKQVNYKKSWMECDDEFVNEFDFVIRWIIKKSKTFDDVRNGFIEYLNLPTLYEFALTKNFIR